MYLGVLGQQRLLVHINAQGCQSAEFGYPVGFSLENDSLCLGGNLFDGLDTDVFNRMVGEVKMSGNGNGLVPCLAIYVNV